MALRPSHGTAKERGHPGSRPETVPANELPPVNATLAAQGTAIAAARGRPFEPGNRAGGKKPVLVMLGVRVDEVEDEAYRAAMRRAASYKRVRSAELCRDHGGILSAGVSATVASEALALAASRLLYQAAGKIKDPAEMADMLRRAGAMATEARQHGIAAFEIAAREGKVRGAGRPVDPVEAEEQRQREMNRRAKAAKQVTVEAVPSDDAPPEAAE